MENKKVLILGLGYVGLTLAVALARKGVKVYALEKRLEVVELTNKGTPHFAENGLAEVLSDVVADGMLYATQSLDNVPPCDYYVITVGTPLDVKTHLPRLDMIEDASSKISAHLTEGATVILRSTVQIGTARNIVKPILDKSNISYNLAMCPERTLEGNALAELAELPQIVGGLDKEAGDKAQELFSVLTNTIVRVDSPELAEMIKLVDNTSRDLNFAFANEIARACTAIGISAYDVIECGKFSYKRTNVAKPGLVGGPCLEKDPHILMHSLKSFGLDLEITKASRLVNERQPVETVDTIFELAEKRLHSKDLKIAVLGMAFKGRPETDDLRGSMSLKIVDAIKAHNPAEIRVFDPVIGANFPPQYTEGLAVFSNIDEVLKDVDVAIIANNHKFFEGLSLDSIKSKMNENAFVYDYWNNLKADSPEAKKSFYFTVGCINP